MSTPPSIKDTLLPQVRSFFAFSHNATPYLSKKSDFIESFKNKISKNRNIQEINKNHCIEANKNFLIKDDKIFSEVYPQWTETNSLAFQQLILDAKFASQAKGAPFKERVDHFINHIADLETHKSRFEIANHFDILGQVICLIDHHPKKLLACIDQEDIQKSIKSISELFNFFMKKIHKKINYHYQAHCATGVQNGEIAKQLMIPIEIAQILLPSSGLFNRALIGRMIEEFCNENDPLNSYKDALRSSLKLLSHSTHLQEKLQSISFSKPQNPFSLEVVRMSLRLPLDKKISDIDARRTALTALLTHLRQGYSNSCFASFFAIELQTQNPFQALEDFSNLLKEGHLSRYVDQRERDFPFLMKWGQEDRAKTIRINKEGYLISPDGLKTYFWKSPGLKKALAILGIVNSKKVIDHWLMTKQIPPMGIEISIQKLIEEIGKGADEKSLERCYLEFSSQNSHPLLRVWENALAGMAEGKKGGLLRKAFTKTLHYLITTHAMKYGLASLAGQNDLIQRIETWTSDRVHYLYDPNYKLAKYPAWQGAFVLYDTKNQGNFESWKRIDTATQFQKLVAELITEFFRRESIPSPLSQRMVEEIVSDKSVVKILQKYHRENLAKLIAKDSLRCTPWVTVIGNDPQEVLKVYYEGTSSYKIHEYIPKNGKDLICFFLLLLSKQSDAIKRRHTYGNHLTPVRVSSIHAFSLLLSHPSMKECYEPSFDTKVWVDKKSYFPGKEIADSFISEQMKKELIDFVCRSLIPPLYKKNFLNSFKRYTKKLSIKDFRCLLAHELSEKLPLATDSDTKAQLKLIDLKIAELMPKEMQQKWIDSVIHFADSNWQKEGRDIHYGIAVNPGSGELEMVAVLDNGEPLEFLDQRDFFTPHKWEIYLYTQTT